MRIFIFGPPDFFADFLAGFFLLIFCGKKCPDKSSRKNSRQNPPKFIQQKSPTHFCRGAGPIASSLGICYAFFFSQKSGQEGLSLTLTVSHLHPSDAHFYGLMATKAAHPLSGRKKRKAHNLRKSSGHRPGVGVAHEPCFW